MSAFVCAVESDFYAILRSFRKPRFQGIEATPGIHGARSAVLRVKRDRSLFGPRLDSLVRISRPVESPSN
jgi:hypothetical protein